VYLNDCIRKEIRRLYIEGQISGWLGTTNNIHRTALGRFLSLREAIAYLESEEGEKIEPLDVENESDKFLVWRG